ncbi:MAG: bifunctional metallophosphatase/5'-nucleotidase [Alistipes sp.]|nr:bifunctional metallophosphatase/5'-nucleotidase [Alistipes sp.]
MRFFRILFSLVLLALTACNTNNNEEQSLYIISTNDMHASIEAMPRLTTLVKEYEALGEVVVVDSGDRVTGNAYVDDDHRPGVPMIELMNEIGYDVVTLGNHEFDKGRDVLNQMVEASDFQWVCANMCDKKGESKIKPYTTLDVAGIRLGIVGVVDTDFGGRPMGGDSSYVDFSFSDDRTTAYEVCREVAPNHDYTILLSHMGYEGDRRLAEMEPACNWIAGGHSHDVVGEDIGTVHLSQNRKDIRYATIAHLRAKGGEVLSVEFEQVELKDYEEDSGTRAIVDYIKSFDPTLNSVVTHANATANKDGIANFTVDALMAYPYADGFEPEIAIYHYGGVRLTEIAEGKVKRVDILNNDPFVSTIYIGEMTLSEIRQFILDKYNNGTAERPDKESHYAYFRANVPYEIVLGNEPETAPDAVDIRFDIEERTYRVALCNYIAENYIDKELVANKLRPIATTVREAMLHLMESYGDKGFTPNNTVLQTEVKE